VAFRYGVDVAHAPDVLAGFDRIVIAAGARYRFGLGRLPALLLDRGAGHWPGLRQLFSWPPFRDWFYHRARRPTGDDFRRLAKPGQKVTVIGDAARAGKSQPAIASAFEAALLGG
jgi:dimethylglycine catabolism A